MSSNPSRIFVLCLLGLLVISTLMVATIYWNIYGYAKLFGDFDVFRRTAVHITSQRINAVYDIEHIRYLLNTHALKDYFVNPPSGLFIVYPLGFIGPVSGLVLWSIVQLILLVAVLQMRYIQQLFASSQLHAISGNVLLLAVALAFCLQNILFGQMAGFCTALFLLVLAWRKTHPLCAGIMLGLFSIKPQLGVLLPLLLLAEHNWKTLLGATLTAALMIMLTLILWGNSLWQDYAAMLEIHSQMIAQDQPLLFILYTSIYGALRNLGIPASAAFACQLFISMLIVFYIWPVLKRGNELHKILMVTLATTLVTPYCLIYDMTLLALPCALWLRRAEANLAERSELIALLLLVLMPLVTILLQIQHIPYSVIAVGFGLVVARRLALREQPPARDTNAVLTS